MEWRTACFKIDPQLLKFLQDCARRARATRSEVIRRAIAEFLKRRGYPVDPSRYVLADDPGPGRSPMLVRVG